MPYEQELEFRSKVSQAYIANQAETIHQNLSPVKKRFAKIPSFDEFEDIADSNVYQPSADSNTVLVYEDPAYALDVNGLLE